MDQKLNRIFLSMTIVMIFVFIGGTLIFKLANPSFNLLSGSSTTLNNQEQDQSIPQGYAIDVIVIIDDGCCGHVDTTPPVIKLSSPRNASNVLGGTNITFDITDDNLYYENKPESVLYRWSTDISNITFSSPYTLKLPEEDGTYVIYLYARDYDDNWSSKVFIFIIGPDLIGPTIKASPPNTSIVLVGTTITLKIDDDNSEHDYQPESVLYRWSTDISNTTLSPPYTLALPEDVGTHILYVYAKDFDDNWSSAVLVFGVTADTSSVSIPPTTDETTTTTTQISPGFLFITTFLAYIAITIGIIWRKNRKNM